MHLPEDPSIPRQWCPKLLITTAPAQTPVSCQGGSAWEEGWPGSLTGLTISTPPVTSVRLRGCSISVSPHLMYKGEPTQTVSGTFLSEEGRWKSLPCGLCKSSQPWLRKTSNDSLCFHSAWLCSLASMCSSLSCVGKETVFFIGLLSLLLWDFDLAPSVVALQPLPTCCPAAPAQHLSGGQCWVGLWLLADFGDPSLLDSAAPGLPHPREAFRKTTNSKCTMTQGPLSSLGQTSLGLAVQS